MKNFDSLLAAYLVFWVIVFVYQFMVARRLAGAERELKQLKQQLGRGAQS